MSEVVSLYPTPTNRRNYMLVDCEKVIDLPEPL
jgi:hypothetical protein